MKIHSDTLTQTDLLEALPKQVALDCISKGSRSRNHAYEVYLYYTGEKIKGDGRRWRNTGQYGADRLLAATYDEHGEWMADLFNKDPDAIIADYSGRDDFMLKTAQNRDAGYDAKFPWLDTQRNVRLRNFRLISYADIRKCPHLMMVPEHTRMAPANATTKTMGKWPDGVTYGTEPSGLHPRRSHD